MISVDELRTKARKKFTAYLRWLIAEAYPDSSLPIEDAESFFPLIIPAARGSAHEPFEQRVVEAKLLYESSKQAKGKGYSVATKTVRTRKCGVQTVIERIFFETERDFIYFIRKKQEARDFYKNLEAIKKAFTECIPSLPRCKCILWLEKHLSVLIHQKEPQYWEHITLCAQWFVENPACGLFLREIPVPVHTKFIEENRSLIFSLYHIIVHGTLPEENTNEAAYQCWGIRLTEAFIRFRLLDGSLCISRVFAELQENSPLLAKQRNALAVCTAAESPPVEQQHAESPYCFTSREIQLPLTGFQTFDFARFDHVFIIENLMVYLTFPPIPNSCCIWGAGFAAVLLKNCTALRQTDVRYFGDLDEHGFAILSEVRNFFPHVQSFCMDEHTYRAFSCYAVEGKASQHSPEELTLTEAERRLFLFLKENPAIGRLEQERISQHYIQERLCEVHTVPTLQP